MSAQVQSALANPKIHFAPVAAAACIDAYAAVTRACTDHDLYAKLEDTCEPMLEGTVALGGACAKDQECATPASGAADCSAGVCVAAQKPLDLRGTLRRRLGEACSATCRESVGTSCAPNEADLTLGVCWVDDGLTCQNGSCATAPKAGEACTSQVFCDREAHCDSSGVCVANLSGAACSGDFQCPSTERCDGILRVCVPLKQNGETCDVGDGCLGGQCEENRCRTWTVARASSCSGLYDSF